jgi:diacylglycerol kinase (ATP)
VRVSLIHHPAAGDDDQPDASTLEQLLKRHGYAVRYQSADDELWAAVLDEPADVIAVAGGDGTVGRVAKKLIGRDIPLAPLPLGTANNIARTLGLTEFSLDDVVASWHNAQRITFDVGIANGPWGARYFVEAMGIGLFACTISDADQSGKLSSLKDADAKIAYAIAMLRRRLERCPSHRLELTLDARTVSGDYVLFEAMNMEFVGPNLYLAPDMQPDDGLLDLVLVTTHDRQALQRSLASWQSGELYAPDLGRHRVGHIGLDWTGFEVHFDDEAWPSDPGADKPQRGRIDVGVERNALHFIAPHAKLRQ